MDLVTAIEVLLGNPFAVDPKSLAEADEALGATNVAATLEAALVAGEVSRSKRLLLALGHSQSRRFPVERVLPADALPDRVARRLPRPLWAYRRIVTAAGRCHEALSRILGASRAMGEVRSETWAACFGHSLIHALELETVIDDHDVLLLGETGTGKEAVARAIQVAKPGGEDSGPAPAGAINAASIPETLVESALFGHVKGAFTGAKETRVGRLRSAHGGSFFLDEVGDLPSTTQVKLLRVIETNEVFPLGSDTAHLADVRYIAATHKDLEAMVERREFRRDLFQRLAGNVIQIPPLRERPEDILEIGEGFVRSYFPESSPERDERIRQWLRSPVARRYPWPGNVRELQNALRNLMLGLAPDLASPAMVAEAGAPSGGATSDVPAIIRNGTASMDEMRDWYLERVLQECGGNLTQAARILGVDRSTVRRRVQELNRRRRN